MTRTHVRHACVSVAAQIEVPFDARHSGEETHSLIGYLFH